MGRLLPVLALLAIGRLAAADLTGRWTGTIEIQGERVPLYLALNQHGQEISGTMAMRDESSATAIVMSELHGDQVTFQSKGLPVRLTFAAGDLIGEARRGQEVLKIELHPAQNTDPRYTFEFGRSSPPAVLKRVEAEYTPEARAARYVGTVSLQLTILADGRVGGDIKVAHSLGLGLDEKAIEAVRQWRFRPAYKDGMPVATFATIEVNFRM